MTVTRLWHFDAPAPIEVNRELASTAPDPATRTILRIGNIANNARLSGSHANSPATASSAAIMSSMLGHDPNATSAKSRWVGQPTDVAMLCERGLEIEVLKLRSAPSASGWAW